MNIKNTLLCTGFIGSASTYHQVHKIYKNKSAKNISKFNIGTVWVNTGANLAYALSIKDVRLITTFGNSFVSLSTLFATTMYYS